jgi:hypothetical protein
MPENFRLLISFSSNSSNKGFAFTVGFAAGLEVHQCIRLVQMEVLLPQVLPLQNSIIISKNISLQ